MLYIMFKAKIIVEPAFWMIFLSVFTTLHRHNMKKE